MSFIWKITQMQCKPVEGSFQDVVIQAAWSCGKTDGDYSGYVYSTCSFPAPVDNFTPYDQLTEQQVLEWCWTNGVDKESAELAVQTQIDNQKNPPVVTPPLPWAN